MNFKLLMWLLRNLTSAVCADLVPSDCEDRPGWFPTYQSRAGGTLQVLERERIDTLENTFICSEVLKKRRVKSLKYAHHRRTINSDLS
ncbi:hypothetical protein NPIL_341 [Nephila pilipes]|uniref:Secreted protein n=1 Tax=Nephila pilipes TaxID=299642 RepID=A0A8X6UQR8_NEPPI|nr:hypothetical protein NPIL_341 [Nephila pilipes]